MQLDSLCFFLYVKSTKISNYALKNLSFICIFLEKGRGSELFIQETSIESKVMSVHVCCGTCSCNHVLPLSIQKGTFLSFAFTSLE